MVLGMASGAVHPFLEAGVETGYRLCRVPSSAPSTKAETGLARPLPDRSGRVALVDGNGGLRLLDAATQDVVACYQLYLGSFAEGDETTPPRPCAIPLTDLAFWPPQEEGDDEAGGQQGLFLLLGETNTVMFTTLPGGRGINEDDEDEERGGPVTAGRLYAYGSPLVALEPAHQARIRAIAVDATGSVLATGDEAGHLRLWALASAAAGRHRLMGGADGLVADVAGAHRGPILSLTHGEALAGEEGHVVTGGRDRAVRVWAWKMDEWGRLGVRPLHTLLTESCEVRCLAAGQGFGVILAGSHRGALYCWSGLTPVLEYVAMGSEHPLTCVAALPGAQEQEEYGEEEEYAVAQGQGASLLVTTDAAGVVRLYRPTHMDPAKTANGAYEEEEEEEDGGWQPVAESTLDGPGVGAAFVRRRAGSGGGGGTDLVVVSRTGLVMPWAVESLPRYPEEDVSRRRPRKQRRQEPQQAAARSSLEEEEEEDERPRGTAPSPSPLGPYPEEEEEEEEEGGGAIPAPPSFSSERAERRDSAAIAAGWAPCELGAPAVNSTARIREALDAARGAAFDPQAVEAETASVLADAARAVNVDPRYRAYRGVRGVEEVDWPRPKVVRRAVDPAWAAKRALAPTARDFFTPGLEGLAKAQAATGGVMATTATGPLALGGGGGRAAAAAGAWEEAETVRVGPDPSLLALYSDTM